MIPTKEQLDILNFVVEDGQAWIDRDVAHHRSRGKMTEEDIQKHVESAVANKCNNHRAKYEAAVAAGNYRNRVHRDADIKQAELDRWAANVPAAKIQRKKELKLKVRKMFSQFVDPFTSRANNPDDGSAVPSEIRKFYLDTKSVYATAKTSIDVLTTVQEIKDFYPTWPEIPDV